MSLRDNFKDAVNFGLGAIYLAKEKVESELDELVKKGKISKEDAKEAVNKAMERGKEEEAEIKSKIKTMIKEAMDEFGIATKEDIQNLRDELKKG